MKAEKFILSPFQVNTYIISDNSGECIIIDPACYFNNEFIVLKNYISNNNLKPVYIINTHGHLDHLFGNKIVSQTYKIESLMHADDYFLLKNFEKIVKTYGLEAQNPDEPAKFLNETDKIVFGNSVLNILHVPGHSPGSIVLYAKEDNFALTGDVIFAGSIGRTDLDGGDFDTLTAGIKNKLFVLDNNCVLYPGHGQKTSVANEKQFNPFLKNI